MGIVSSLRKALDRPVWEWMRFAPAVSSSLSCSAMPQNPLFHVQHGRYIYYLISATSFWRYDTWTDTYLQLSSPGTSPTVFSSMRFLSNHGFEGRVLSASAGSITIPAYFGQALKGFDVVIVSGTGAGQRRVISGVADAVIADSGLATGISNSNLSDSTKAWSINQWAGYQVRFTGPVGGAIGIVRRVLYNSATNLTWADTNKYAEDTLCNPYSNMPGSGTQQYQIEASVASIDQNWTVQPDATSRFRVLSGAIILTSAVSGSTSLTMQWYDVASDTWYTKSCPASMTPTAPTDGCLEAGDESSVVWSRGFATAGTTTTLTDTLQSWTVNQWVGYWVFVGYGTGSGQMKKITANTSNTLTFATGTAPDTTSSYMIIGFDGGTATSGAASTLTDTAQAWTTNRWKNSAVRILAGTGAGQVLPVASNTATAITTVKPWSTQPDNTSVYAIVPNQDQMHIMLGQSASVFCYGIDDDLVYHGRLNDSGAARIGAVQFGGFKPQAIASITKSGTTATVTTVNPIGFPSGSSVTISGATGADAATYNITAAATITGATTFTYAMGATPASNAVFGSQSTTTLLDSTKNWTTNQWAGSLCHMTVTAGSAPTGQTMIVASNTANTLTFTNAITAPVNGTTRYVLTPNTIPGAIAVGTATGAGQTTTTLVDTSQTWVVNQWFGRRVRITGGAGENSEVTIASNTATTLTLSSALSAAPIASSTTYAILLPSIRGAGIETRFAFGMSDATRRGRYLLIARGSGNSGFDRLDIVTDLFELMATSPQSETLGTGSMFAYDGGDRLYFTKDNTQRCYYLDIPTSTIQGAGIYPYVAGTSTIGNRMEIFVTSDGLKFLWLNRHSNMECFRTLLFW